MHDLAVPPRNILEKWFALLPQDRPELLLPSQHLVLGPDLAELIHLPPPAPQPLTELLRLLRDRAPAILDYVLHLAEESSPGRHALLELAVDVLVGAADGWRHPSQVLDYPRPEYRELLPICLERLRLADDSERTHLEEVTIKVETAARIAEEARLRRRRKSEKRLMFRTRLVVACHDGVSFLPKWLLYEIECERWIVMLKLELLQLEMAPDEQIGDAEALAYLITLGRRGPLPPGFPNIIVHLAKKVLRHRPSGMPRIPDEVGDGKLNVFERAELKSIKTQLCEQRGASRRLGADPSADLPTDRDVAALQRRQPRCRL